MIPSASFYFNLARFYYFQYSIHPQTWTNQRLMQQWAIIQSKNDTFQDESQFLFSDDPVVRNGYVLRKKLFSEFVNKYQNSKLRILIHRPASSLSPGGYSLFNNLLQGLQFLGVPARAFWDEPLSKVLQEFKPTVLLSSDSSEYLHFLDSAVIKQYKKKHPLSFGLTASIEAYGNSPLQERLNWAKSHDVDFFYSFRSPEYLHTREEYLPFFENNFQILSVEFGANPLLYYPLPTISRDIPYVFLASSNTDKWQRYFSYLPPIVSKYPGIIDGPGWYSVKKWLPVHLHKYAYARAKVGLNLHISDSIEWSSELNERTYILAASGVPQLIDNPLLLSERFSEEAFFVAHSPKEYLDLFHYILEDKQESERRALLAQNEVLQKHTSFHRAESFIKQLEKLL